MEKKIKNVVFYSFNGERGRMHQACIFYEDGTVKNVSHEEGLEAARIIVDEENVKTRDEFLELLNSRRIYKVTGEELERRFKEFLGTSIIPSHRRPKPIVSSKKKKTTPPVTPPVGETDADEDEADNKFSFFRKKKKKKKDKNKKDNFFTRIWKKLKKNKIVKALTTTVLILGLAIGSYRCGRNSLEGEINQNNITSESDMNFDNFDNIEAQDLAYLKLLNETPNKTQKQTMTHQGNSMDLFNRDFANEYIQSGSNVKAALTWDEMMALNLAYNTYTKDQIRVMFNGVEIDSKAMSDAYKNATLQLMASYVIETRENPVNSSKFLISKEEQAFVEKYNDLFLKCKETTGEARIAAVNAFYKELYKDFPISNEVREEGISHADGREQLDSYKLAVTPIVGAVEMMFQNLDIDHTLSDKATAYFNDLGLCNIAEEKFERAMTITLSAETDEPLPTYDEFRTAKIEELKLEDNYVIDDANRDLSQLEEFQKWVNGHFEIVDGVNTGKIIENKKTKSSTTKTETKTKVTTDRSEAVKEAGASTVKKAEEQVDTKVSEENKKAKEQAEKEAEQNRQQQQNQANNEKEKQEAEVEANDKDLQDKIDAANNSSTQTNEADFGDHNVDFSPEHSDEDGNLNNSVTDITTDGTGDKTNEPLPDPNETGAVFDATGESTKTRTYQVPVESGSKNSNNQNIYEYEEKYTPSSLTKEQIVDEYIKQLEQGSGSNESGYQYTK